jgi:cytochrome c oxidase subunit 1
MWGEVLGWVAVPLLAAWLARRTGRPPAPVMAAATGVAVIGHGVTGIVRGFLGPSPGIDAGLHDTYYVVAADHYLLQVGALLFVLALPLALIARGIPRLAALGPLLFMTLHIGAGLTLFPQRMLNSGVPRRYVEYEGYFEAVNQMSYVGAIMSFIALSAIAAATVVALYRMGRARRTR